MRKNFSLLIVVLVLAVGAQTYAQPRCVPPPSGMVAWLPFDESNGTTTVNRRKLINPGTLLNGPVFGTGKVSNGLTFDGQNDSVQVQNYPEINFGDGNFSIDAWIQIQPNASSGVKVIVDKRAGTDGMGVGYMFFVIDGRLALQLNTPTQGFYNYFDTTSPTVATGRWHHVAVTVQRTDASGIKFYIDGTQLPRMFDPRLRQGNLNNTSTLKVGREVSGNFFTGKIDEVELFNRVLTREEVNNLFRADSAGKCKNDSDLEVSVGCPRIDSDIAWQQFQIEPNPTDNNTYTLKFNPTIGFKNDMQSFANSLTPNPPLTTLGIIWSVEDCGSAWTTCNWQNPKLAVFGTGWKNPTGYFGWNPTDFSVGPNSSPSQYRMKVNNRYMVYSWENLDGYGIKGPCPDSDFRFAILREGPNMRTAEPVVEVQNAKGKIIRREPLRPLPPKY